MGERIIPTEHQPKDNEDPEYSHLMKSSTDEDPSTIRLMPLHSYYGEFRLGHGDPLFKAAMQQWPCTTTDFAEPETSTTRKISSGDIFCLSPHSAASMMPFNDILKLDQLGLEHESTVVERRYVLLDEEGNEMRGAARRVSF
jgi:hypothetical protein